MPEKNVTFAYEKIKLKFLLSYRGYKSGPFGSALILDQLDQDGKLLIYSPEHINDMDTGSFYLPEERYSAMKQFFLESNDIFFPIVGTLGKAKIFDENMPTGMLNQRLARISPNTNKVLPAFLKLCMCEYDDFKQQLDLYSRGAILEHITKDALMRIAIPLPTIKEQKLVLAYLDRLTAQIDSLLSDLQAQTEMLDTYKRELIAEVVTKGLDKSVPMKDSGVDWIGETPVHWETTKTKWMFEIVKRLYDKEDRDVLSITQRGLKVKDIESNDGQLAESYIGYQVVNVNDFAMNSMDLLTGWVDCSLFEGVTSPDYRVFRFVPSKPQCHNYYKYLFQMCYKNRIFYRLGQGVSNLGRWRLQADQFLNMRLPQPPVEEQKQIAAYLDEKTAKIEGLNADITAQIEKLKQYRQIVIHDAVTGKIKITEGE